jgi:hypothetical protein
VLEKNFSTFSHKGVRQMTVKKKISHLMQKIEAGVGPAGVYVLHCTKKTLPPLINET